MADTLWIQHIPGRHVEQSFMQLICLQKHVVCVFRNSLVSVWETVSFQFQRVILGHRYISFGLNNENNVHFCHDSTKKNMIH